METGYAEKLRGTCREVSGTDTLYMNLNVLTNGTLENGKITINSKNMKLSTALVKDGVIKENYISEDTRVIELNTINYGTQKLISGAIKASEFGNNINNYSQINSVVLTGTHVAEDGTRTEINKSVNFIVDWHGKVQASIYNYTGTQNIDNIVSGANQDITLSFSITTR